MVGKKMENRLNQKNNGPVTSQQVRRNTSFKKMEQLTWEIVILSKIKDIPGGKSNIPCGRNNFPHEKLNFPGGKSNIPGEKLNFPGGKSNIPYEKFNFPGGKLNIPHGKLNIPPGIRNIPGKSGNKSLFFGFFTLKMHWLGF
jgi:hypothetical protein